MKICLLLVLALPTILLPFVSSGMADTFILNPFSDAFAATGPSGNLSGNNYGGGGALALAAPNLPNGEFQTVMEFNLASANSAFNTEFGAGQWSVQSATLQLTATPHPNPIYNNLAAGQFNISLMQNNSWVEGTGTAGAPTMDGISFNTLMSTYINNATDQTLGRGTFSGGTSGTTSTSLNLTPDLLADLTGGNDLSLRLYAADNAVSYLFSSRSDPTAANRPELIFQVSDIPEPGSLALDAMGLAAFWFWRWVLPSRK